MSDFEEKLSAILSDQNAMTQIMSLARSLGGSQNVAPADPSFSSNEISTESAATNIPSALGSVDPRLLSAFLNVLSAYNSEDDCRANLLAALRPFVKKERYSKLDQAIQVSKITRAVRAALESFHSGEVGSKNV